MAFRLRIITPDKEVIEDDCELVSFWTVEGSMGVLTHRAPIITALSIAELKVKKTNGEESFYAVHGGYMDVDGEEATVITDAAENWKEIDLARAEKSKQKAEELLKKAQSDREEARAKAKINRAFLRIKLSQRQR
ncbi:MAG: F-type H+-transporting ATPase subunit epsilon [Thermotogaceae bacterium]|nr:F-type H+-transporting ATPase subunit epsilon [Thermotogaceae bacterium]MDN5338400.1 F-type H+-transporting ATPase subunit epsilon [Thermotogaceae bacterium]